MTNHDSFIRYNSMFTWIQVMPAKQPNFNHEIALKNKSWVTPYRALSLHLITTHTFSVQEADFIVQYYASFGLERRITSDWCTALHS